MKNITLAATSVVAWLLLLTVGAPRASADTFNLTSCHIGTGCPAAGTVFGTVTLVQSGTSVNFDVVLSNGSRFVETGAGGGSLFLFNDALAGSTITSISTTLNGTPTSLAASGFTNISPLLMADGTGDWSAAVKCTDASLCNGGSTPNINDLHFTVTNATLAQLEIKNDGGNYFVADILCGPTVTGCAGNTGPVDASVPPTGVPDGGMTLTLLGGALVGLETLRRRFRA